MNKIAQGLLCRTEQTVVKCYFDGLVRRVGTISNYGNARNEIIKTAEAKKYDWIVFLDSDEELQESGISLIKRYIEAGVSDAFGLPRIEFVKDQNHYDDSVYPDWQHRVFRLNSGFSYRGDVHETLYKGSQIAEVVHLIRCPIYHYGKCESKEFLALKYLNYERMKAGLPTLDKLPDNYPLDTAKFWEKEIQFLK